MPYEDTVVTYSVTNEWLYSKSFLRSRCVGQVVGDIVFEREVTWYWDSAQRVLRQQSFEKEIHKEPGWGHALVEVGDDEIIRGKTEYVRGLGMDRDEPFFLSFSIKRNRPDSFTF